METNDAVDISILHDLKISDINLLLAICSLEWIEFTTSDLSKKTGRTADSIRYNLRRLKKKGLIDETIDFRSRRYHLTHKGKETCQIIKDNMEKLPYTLTP